MKKIISILLLLTMILNTTIPTINSIVVNASEISSENSEQISSEEVEKSKVEDNEDIAKEEQEETKEETEEVVKEENAPPSAVVIETEEELTSANNNKTQEFLIVSSEIMTKATYNVEMYPHDTLDIGDFSSSHWGELMYFIVNGDIVFCIESTKDINNSANSQTEAGSVFSTFSSSLRLQIEIISAYGLQKYQETGNDNYLYATQLLIWKAIEPSKYDLDNGTLIQNEINEIFNLFQNHSKKPTFMGSTESNAPTNTLKWNESTGRYEVTLNDTNNVASYKLEDFPNSSGDYNFSLNGDKLTISTTNDNASSDTIEYKYTPYGNGANKYYDGGQDLIQASVDPFPMYLKLEVEPTLGDLEITKVGESLEPNSNETVNLEGAEFNLVDSEGNVVSTGTTDKNGNLEFNNLKSGDYTLVETNAPEGYLIASNTNVEIVPNQVVNVEINDNIITSDITLTKVGEEYDGTFETLKDVEFTLYQDVDEDDNYETEIGKFYTDNLGVMSIANLKYGNYKLVETSVGDNYYADFQSEFNVRTNGEVITLDSNGEYVVNEKIRTEIHIYKTGDSLDPDSEEILALEGADFTLFEDVNSNGILEDYEILFNQIETKSTDSEGNIIFDNILPYENYIIKETKAPEGYATSDELILVNSDTEYTINKDLKVAEYTINNEILTNDIYVKKTDFATKEALEGAELQILDSEGNVVDSWISTTEEHYVKVEYGNYTICEKIAPEGYLLSTECIKFSVSEQGIEQHLELDNEVITNDVYVKKTDFATKEALEGAELQILDSEGNVVDSWISTTEEHYVKVEYGNYTICEKVAPEGYLLSTECIKFSVSEQGIEQHLELDNEVITNDVYVKKTDFATKEALEGAELQILDSEGNVVDSWISTTEEHYVKVEYGNYTICEKVAPEGYLLSTECIKFSVSEQGIEQHLELDNELLPTVKNTGINNNILLISILICILLFVFLKRKYLMKY